MNHEKIHPYLLRTIEESRKQILFARAEAAIRLEMADERIEEREYDEQLRLRKQRFIDRRIVRADALRRYAILTHDLPPETAKQEVTRRLDQDLRSIASDTAVKADLSGAIRSYDAVMPAEQWPPVLCMAESLPVVSELRDTFTSLGLALLPVGLLERFGILKFACPPEMTVLREIAALPSIHVLAAPTTPVLCPEPFQTAAPGIDIPSMLGITAGMTGGYGHDITLAVLDTGLDLRHPAFARLKPDDYRNFTGASDEDTEGHGTHVASIAGGHDPSFDGLYSGIAPRCRLVVGKVISEYGGMLEDILNGMAWAVFEKRADILSLSLGDGETPANGRSIWSRACEEAYRHGTLVCAAAGNVDLPHPGTIAVPADSRYALAVGAVDNRCRLAPFSAKGSTDPDSPLHGKPECVAPGVGIIAARSSASAYPAVKDDPLHTALSGTSMAVQTIAGCLALIKSAGRERGWEMSPQELLDLFYAACRSLNDPEGETYRSDFEIGHGLVDMERAFDLVKQRPRQPTVPVESRTIGVEMGERRFSASALTVKEEKPIPLSLDPLISEEFLNGFDFKVRQESLIVNPIDRRQLRITRKSPAQNFNRVFGRVRQFPLKTLWQRLIESLYFSRLADDPGAPQMVLAAIALGKDGFQPTGEGYVPAPDLLHQVAGQSGLDIHPRTFYAVGILSQVGWPAPWGQGQSSGNSIFYFVEKDKAGNGWTVAGPDPTFKQIFNPERWEDEVGRARGQLASHPDLIFPGGHIRLEPFLSQFNLSRAAVEVAVRDSGNRLRIIDDKGRSAVQRTSTGR